jgi:hypothetical protein
MSEAKTWNFKVAKAGQIDASTLFEVQVKVEGVTGNFARLRWMVVDKKGGVALESEVVTLPVGDCMTITGLNLRVGNI